MTDENPIRVRSTFSQNPGTLICDTQDIWPLTGLPLMSPVQIAELKTHGIAESQWLAMERHVGLLHLVDSASGNTILCAPTGDTVRAVDKELQENGISAVSW